jgi:hypothetical protein
MGRPRKINLPPEDIDEIVEINSGRRDLEISEKVELSDWQNASLRDIKAFDSRSAQIAVMNKLKEDPEIRPFIVPNENWGAVNAILLLRLIKVMESNNV